MEPMNKCFLNNLQTIKMVKKIPNNISKIIKKKKKNLLITHYYSIVMYIIWHIHIPGIYLKSYKSGIFGGNLINCI